jgi:hypothetical protein
MFKSIKEWWQRIKLRRAKRKQLGERYRIGTIIKAQPVIFTGGKSIFSNHKTRQRAVTILGKKRLQDSEDPTKASIMIHRGYWKEVSKNDLSEFYIVDADSAEIYMLAPHSYIANFQEGMVLEFYITNKGYASILPQTRLKIKVSGYKREKKALEEIIENHFSNFEDLKQYDQPLVFTKKSYNKSTSKVPGYKLIIPKK